MIATEKRPSTWSRFWSRRNGDDNAETQQKLDKALAKISAIDQSNALIEFALDGTILEANQNFLDVMGYTREEIVGQHHRMFLDATYAESDEYRRFWDLLRSGKFHSERFVRYGKGGKEIFIQATYNPVFGLDGRPERVIKIATDVTQEVHLQREAERLMHMVESLPINLMFADNDLIIRYINPASYKSFQAVARLLPVPVDKVVGSSLDIFHKDPAYQRRRLADRGNLPINATIRLGDEVLQLDVNAIDDRSGSPFGVMATWAVITEHARIREGVANLGTVGQAVASNVRDMGAAITEISENVGRTATLALTAEEKSREAGTTISALGESSIEIDEVVTLIRDLAEQTNLLALNATIEAARAGEAGRGFAVVASEVKSLATGTHKATETIAQRVEKIRASIDNVVASTNQISQSIQEVSGNTTEVAAAIEQQSAIINTMGTTADELLHLSSELRKL